MGPAARYESSRGNAPKQGEEVPDLSQSTICLRHRTDSLRIYMRGLHETHLEAAGHSSSAVVKLCCAAKMAITAEAGKLPAVWALVGTPQNTDKEYLFSQLIDLVGTSNR